MSNRTGHLYDIQLCILDGWLHVSKTARHRSLDKFTSCFMQESLHLCHTLHKFPVDSYTVCKNLKLP